MIERITIIGTDVLGSSIGLALAPPATKARLTVSTTTARSILPQSIAKPSASLASRSGPTPGERAVEPDNDLLLAADVIISPSPVLAIKDWMHKLAPILKPHQLVTDVCSTKLEIADLARQLFNSPTTTARFLPGHPMACRTGGASRSPRPSSSSAPPGFSPPSTKTPRLEQQWRDWVGRPGASLMDLDPAPPRRALRLGQPSPADALHRPRRAPRRHLRRRPGDRSRRYGSSARPLASEPALQHVARRSHDQHRSHRRNPPRPRTAPRPHPREPPHSNSATSSPARINSASTTPNTFSNSKIPLNLKNHRRIGKAGIEMTVELRFLWVTPTRNPRCTFRLV